jgi:D-3-phosphoglycerate dehydrogenase
VGHKVLITTSSFGEEGVKRLKDNGLQVLLSPYKRKMTEEEVKAFIYENQPTGMIAGVEPLTKAVLQSADNLKVISRCGIGMDSVDLEAARNLEIVVTNTPDAPTTPVAELTIGMILTLLRGVHNTDASIRRGEWVRPMGLLLKDKVVGIVGCGRIGSYLAGLLSVFRCGIVGYDPIRQDNPKIEYVELDELLKQADIVSLHIPFSNENNHFMDEQRIGNMKKGAILVNVARGGLIDEDALCEALKSGHIGGAAIDCFEQEPYRGPLKDMENVLLTAHIGSYAKEGRAIMERESVDNLLRELEVLKVIS